LTLKVVVAETHATLATLAILVIQVLAVDKFNI